eukprot:TRINITY_DN161_c0_g1_i3.p1 TRINITY_DN161_c0_g1~~TRINITY_DN161_c0_g1_i3.p1  ORF type:complete len:336 (+),score=183.55 TRINITY_DN161_c0_g1_i3:150-1157(+)
MTDLQSTFEHIGLTGHHLTPSEQAALTCSLAALSKDFGAPVVFWGRVEGYKANYMIAQTVSVCAGHGVELEALGKEKSLYSVDGGHNWSLLESDPSNLQKEFSQQIRGKFTGNPRHEYKVQQRIPEVEEKPTEKKEEAKEDDAEKKDEDEEGEEKEEKEDAEEEAPPAAEEEAPADEEDAPKKPKKKTMIVAMLEETRLAFFVHDHDKRCKVLPSGQLVLASEKLVAPNKTFLGLSTRESMEVGKYLHYRKPLLAQLPQKGSHDYNPVVDFLEPLSTDIPSGVWSLFYDPSMSIVIGKNFMYPGTVFYHQPNTRCFGQYYFGTGEVNLDLCMMMP